jgi:tryptophanyl-tRNA synthetase
MKNQTILSGIKPSGIPTLGNYIGAIHKWLPLQEQYSTCLFPIVDLHALTVAQDPKELTQQTYVLAAFLLAAGINPKRSILFLQSHVPAHAELGWLITTQSTMGELSRMTQFKDKAENKSDGIGTGLFTYPALMAADIFLYQTNVVPVGDDQKQHVELARDLAERFNKRYGKTFVVPTPVIAKEGARIMSLDDPTQKMSKSNDRDKSYILVTDTPDAIRKKIMSATTDSDSTIVFDPERKGLFNLLTIFKILSGKTEKQIEKQFEGHGYGVFKAELAELIIKTLEPIQTKMAKLLKDKKQLDKILADGAKRASKLAAPTLALAKKRIGLV